MFTRKKFRNERFLHILFNLQQCWELGLIKINLLVNNKNYLSLDIPILL